MTKIQSLSERLQEIALQKKTLTNEEDVIKQSLLEEMSREQVEKLQLEYGTISKGTRTTYTFTDAIKKLKDKVKIKEQDEIKQGLATAKTTDYLTFREVTQK